jgi:hypothetical protein
MFKFEVTDTYGGEANYCWVRRHTTKATSRAGLMRAIKQATGWPQVRVIYWDGENMEARPPANSGILHVAFAHWDDRTTAI